MIERGKVSIVIPVYNGADYLSEAIESALAQDYENFEVLVVNDGSVDGGETERIALEYAERIRYYSKPNGGVASALNYAIEVMEGDYFSWLSHDDLYAPNKISRQMSALMASGEGKELCVFCRAASFTEDVASASLIDLPKGCSAWFRYFLSTSTALHGCTLLVPRQAFREVGFFDTKLRTTQDYDMWFRLAGKYKFVEIADVLVMARQHQKQGTVTMRETVRLECEELVCGFLDELCFEDVQLASGSMDCAYLNISRISYRRGLVKAARRSLLKVGTRAYLRACFVFIAGECRNFIRGLLVLIGLR
ncbi:glycosyltransferase family 2 protein [Pseudomonas sp.]|uniref:glycosyltransferase family 2 protein n=1 Tax=Pseudomonas sp. TaxID=306 RepID=UPI003D0DF243